MWCGSAKNNCDLWKGMEDVDGARWMKDKISTGKLIRRKIGQTRVKRARTSSKPHHI